MRDGFNGVCSGALALLCPLQSLPIDEYFLGSVRPGGAEDMGMAVYQLLGHAVYHVVHGKAALLRLDLSMKSHLHQKIPKLFAHGMGVIPVQGV